MNFLIFLIYVVIPGIILAIIFSRKHKKNKEKIASMSDEEKKAINVKKHTRNYFTNDTTLPGVKGGAYASLKSDAEYEKIVKSHFSIEETKNRALETLGLDESEITEIDPIFFEDYYFGTDEDIEQFLEYRMNFAPISFNTNYDYLNIMLGIGKDGKLRSSAYQVTWLFSTPKQVCVYQKIFYLHKGETEEINRLFPWKHVTSISTSRKSLKLKGEKRDYFLLNVAGSEPFECTMVPTDKITRAIFAISQKLLE